MASSNPWPRKAAGLAGITVGLLGCAAGGFALKVVWEWSEGDADGWATNAPCLPPNEYMQTYAICPGKIVRNMLPKFLWTIPLLFNGSLLGVAACFKALSEPPPAPKPNSFGKKKKPAKKKAETKKKK